jgi:capsular exopolysaccharide synthesis family protein
LNAAPPYISDYVTVDSREYVLERLWRVLLKRKWLVAACAIIVVTITTIASFRMTKLYDAQASISINKESNDDLGLKSSASSSDDFWDYTVELETQTKILQSEALALQVIRDYKLDKHPYFAKSRRPTAADSGQLGASSLDDARIQSEVLSLFASGLRVNPVPRTRIIEIHYASPDPVLSATVANAVAQTYIQQNMRTKYETTVQTSDWISKQLSDLKLKVETSQEKLVRYQKDHGIIGIDEKQNIITSKLDELNRQLTAAETDRIQKEADYRLASSGDAELVAKVDTNTVLDRLRLDRASLQSQFAQLNATFGPSYPKIVELRSQLEAQDRQIQAEIQKIAQRIKNNYMVALQREKLLLSVFERQKQEANGLNESAIEYNILKRDLDTSRELYDGLLQRLKEAGVRAGLRSSNIRVIDAARTPLGPSSPNIPRNIALGLLVGLFGGVVLAFVQESLDNTIMTPEQVESLTAWPALGIIPRDGLKASFYRLPRKATSRRSLPANGQSDVALVVHCNPNSEVAESYRALRTSILLSALGGPPKVIMVTSGLPQEGKTTTAMNAATVLAQRGSRVLLVDADLRRPRVHQILKARQSPGLSNLLTGCATVDEVVQPTGVPNLFVVTAGSPPPHPAELLGSELMRNHLQGWRAQFDHVIIDTPPILSVTDAVMLSAYVESAVIVVRAGKTRKEGLRRSHELLSQVKAHVLGVVINGVDLGSPEHYYYYYGKRYGDAGYYSSEEKTESTTA